MGVPVFRVPVFQTPIISIWKTGTSKTGTLITRGGPLGYISVHMREQENTEKGVIFREGHGTYVSHLGVKKCLFLRKRGVFENRVKSV